MVLALLHESDLVLSDDVVETIVDKVQITTFPLHFFMLILYKYSKVLVYCHRHLTMRIQKVMEKLIKKSGRNLY
jgi:hypothetical protein